MREVLERRIRGVLVARDIDAHLAAALPVYRRKRDLMLATMAEPR